MRKNDFRGNFKENILKSVEQIVVQNIKKKVF